MSSILIGIDVGSSACKCIIVDDRLRPISQGAQSYPTHYPQAAAAEQDPEDWYRSACQALRNCLESSGIKPANVMPAFLSPDPPIASRLWMALATFFTRPYIGRICAVRHKTERLETDYGDAIFAAALCRVNPAWTLPQLLWLRENRHTVYRRLASHPRG